MWKVLCSDIRPASRIDDRGEIIYLKNLSVSDLQSDYLNFYNVVINNKREILINKGAVTVEFHIQLRNNFSNR